MEARVMQGCDCVYLAGHHIRGRSDSLSTMLLLNPGCLLEFPKELENNKQTSTQKTHSQCMDRTTP
jgi:hypothetical protein